MNNDDLWRPGTELEPPAEVPPSARLRRVGVQRRRVLFTAGGLTLLAGAGVATAAAVTRSGALGTAGPATRAAGNGSPALATATTRVGATTPPGIGSQGPGSGTGPGSTSTGQPPNTTPPTSPPTSPTSPSAPPSGSSTPALPPGNKVQTAPQWYADDGPMTIALTMDDGPDSTYTPQVLAVLHQYGIKATFNMIGRQVGGNLSLVREVSAAGHTITNHTWDHADLTKYTYAQVCSEIDRCNDALSEAGQHPTIFRAPYGNWSTAVFQACAAYNLRPVGWTVDPKDWSRPGVTSIVNNVMKNTHQHDIILEHDGGGDRSQTVAAMKIFIPELLNKGFHFVAM